MGARAAANMTVWQSATVKQVHKTLANTQIVQVLWPCGPRQTKQAKQISTLRNELRSPRFHKCHFHTGRGM